MKLLQTIIATNWWPGPTVYRYFKENFISIQSLHCKQHIYNKKKYSSVNYKFFLFFFSSDTLFLNYILQIVAIKEENRNVLLYRTTLVLVHTKKVSGKSHNYKVYCLIQMKIYVNIIFRQKQNLKQGKYLSFNISLLL